MTLERDTIVNQHSITVKLFIFRVKIIHFYHKAAWKGAKNSRTLAQLTKPRQEMNSPSKSTRGT